MVAKEARKSSGHGEEVVWHVGRLWKNMNAWCFQNTQRQCSAPILANHITEEFRQLRALRRVGLGVGVFDNGWVVACIFFEF
jgi:hypothetical protein